MSGGRGGGVGGPGAARAGLGCYFATAIVYLIQLPVSQRLVSCDCPHLSVTHSQANRIVPMSTAGRMRKRERAHAGGAPPSCWTNPTQPACPSCRVGVLSSRLHSVTCGVHTYSQSQHYRERVGGVGGGCGVTGAASPAGRERLRDRSAPYCRRALLREPV